MKAAVLACAVLGSACISDRDLDAFCAARPDACQAAAGGAAPRSDAGAGGGSAGGSTAGGGTAGGSTAGGSTAGGGTAGGSTAGGGTAGGAAGGTAGGGAAGGAAGGSVPAIVDYADGGAHFVLDQAVVPLGAGAGLTYGHGDAFPVARPDLGAGMLYLYHRCHEASVPVLCLSISTDDGSTFAPPAVVLRPSSASPCGTEASVSRSSVLKLNGLWLLAYEARGTAAGACWADSTDGVAWTRRGAIVSDGAYHGSPGLFVDGATVYLFSTLITAGPIRVTLHSGPGLTSLTPRGVVFASARAWSSGMVDHARVFKSQGQFFMTYQGANQYDLCGFMSSQAVMGWGLARATNAALTAWQELDAHPVMQSRDAETCGHDLPAPYVSPYTGKTYVYHSSDDSPQLSALKLQRSTLMSGRGCPGSNPAPDWAPKNHACLPSCGGLGGPTATCQWTKACPAAMSSVGASWDCTTCCR